MANIPTIESTEYDSLFHGQNYGEIKSFPVVVTGGALKRGALVTFADGKVKAVATATDAVFGILVEDVDASSADVESAVYVNGDFNKSAVIVASDLAIDDFVLASRNVGIFLR